MNKFIITVLCLGILGLIGFIAWKFVSVETPDVTPAKPIGYLPEEVQEQQQVVLLEKTFSTRSGNNLSAEPFLKNPQIETIASDTFIYTDAPEFYDIMFYEPEGLLTILLYDENLQLARSLAEKQLQIVLPYTNEQLCDLSLRVVTNQYVSPEYSGLNLGLSFCPFSVKF